MSEISREESIDLLDNLKGMIEDSQGNDYDEALNKAISEMEKLEKIIELYEPKPFGKGLSREDRDKMIEQIVEE